jgi:hypothetical protein
LAIVGQGARRVQAETDDTQPIQVSQTGFRKASGVGAKSAPPRQVCRPAPINGSVLSSMAVCSSASVAASKALDSHHKSGLGVRKIWANTAHIFNPGMGRGD